MALKFCVIALVLSGALQFGRTYDIEESNEAEDPALEERDPDPARGRYGYSRYSRQSYSSNGYHSNSYESSGYQGNSYYSNGYQGNVNSAGSAARNSSPNIDRFKAQSDSGQNVADRCFSGKSYGCDARAKYRTVDGTCNNLRRPWWGSVNTAHVRLMEPYYEDGVSEYRRSQADGTELPSARLLSRIFLPDANVSDIHTRMYLQFSQLVAHDVTLNPQESSGPKCCSDSGDAVRSLSGNCHPIVVPTNDDFYSQYGRRCLEYKQSEGVANCSVGALQPIVRSTHFIDVSFMYGSLPEKVSELRSFSRGQLKVRAVDGKAYMPTQATSGCPFAKKSCYNAGDVRVNQHLDLAVSQTVWLRLHNYIADKLIQLNPHWSNRDELVYQETRRIMGAVFQHITYNEWLPILIGPEYARKAGLSPNTNSSYFSGYNDQVNPSTLADFAGGAFRGLHSLIPGVIKLANERRGSNRVLPYSTTLQRPGDFLEEGDTYDSTLRGLGSQPEQYQDRFMTEQITNFLLDGDVPESGRSQFGDDLSARDIQRGRDFGLRPYVEYRELCGLPQVNTFRDLNDYIQGDQIRRLAQAYNDVNDIDYYIGGLLEATIQGSLSSPSFRCVFAEAFYRYKYGDRYFYEGSPSYNPGAFTPAQLSAIKGSFLSQVNCIGSDNISQMQVLAFYEPSQSNPIVPCARLKSDFDAILNQFQE